MHAVSNLHNTRDPPPFTLLVTGSAHANALRDYDSQYLSCGGQYHSVESCSETFLNTRGILNPALGMLNDGGNILEVSTADGLLPHWGLRSPRPTHKVRQPQHNHSRHTYNHNLNKHHHNDHNNQNDHNNGHNNYRGNDGSSNNRRCNNLSRPQYNCNQ